MFIFRSLGRATGAGFIALVVSLGSSIGVASAASAEEPALTADTLFTNDRDISLDRGSALKLSTPLGESVTETVTLTATQDLTLQSVSENATPGEPFYVTRDGVCPSYFGTVTMKAGDSCTLTVVFTPSNPSGYFGRSGFVATVNGVKNSFGVNFQGNVETVVLSGVTEFGNVRIGQSSIQQLTLTNVARYDFIPAELLEGLVTSYGFSVADTTCGDVLSAGASCTIDLQFAPIYIFEASSLVYVTGTMGGYSAYSNALGITATSVEGTAELTVTPSLDFGEVAIDSSTTGTIVLSNTGEATLIFNTYDSWFSDFSGAFAFGGELPRVLQPGESAEVPVVFSASSGALGEQLSDLYITGYTQNYASADATVALRALVAEKVDPVDPGDPGNPASPVKPVPPTGPESTRPEQNEATVPTVSVQNKASAAAADSKLAVTGANVSLAAMGAALLLSVGVVTLWAARRQRSATPLP